MSLALAQAVGLFGSVIALEGQRTTVLPGIGRSFHRRSTWLFGELGVS